MPFMLRDTLNLVVLERLFLRPGPGNLNFASGSLFDVLWTVLVIAALLPLHILYDRQWFCITLGF
jgi:hypothetical protein